MSCYKKLKVGEASDIFQNLGVLSDIITNLKGGFLKLSLAFFFLFPVIFLLDSYVEAEIWSQHSSVYTANYWKCLLSSGILSRRLNLRHA